MKLGFDMDDLIYKFLIQSDFPRASIVTDVSAVDRKLDPSAISFVIVDPDTTDILAVISVVGPVNAELLTEHSSRVAAETQRVGGQRAQGYVVRVDSKAKREAEQVQFYRCHPNKDIQQLSARTFPDLDSLRVNFKLMTEKSLPEPEIIDLPDDVDTAPRLSAFAYMPAVVLLLLGVIDWVSGRFFGTNVFEITHALLFVSAAILFSLPPILRYFR